MSNSAATNVARQFVCCLFSQHCLETEDIKVIKVIIVQMQTPTSSQWQARP